MNIIRIIKAFLLSVCVTAFVSGCASNAVPKSDTSEAAEDAYQYVIGAGDVLDIFVWGYPDLSVKIPVRPDGKITTRLVEDLQASGRTPTDVARDIETRYKAFVNNPTVTVSIDEFVGAPSQQVKVIGGGEAPESVPYTNGMTLLDLMIIVGGLGEHSSGNKSVLVRKVGDTTKSYKARVGDLIQKGDISANVQLQPGDILIIPESWF